jgi:ribosomal protein S18 acetylase RimI-like enzyme
LPGRDEFAVITVRWAGTDDAMAVATIQVESWKVAYRGLVDQAYLDQLDAAERMPLWREGLAEYVWPNRGTLVAEADGRVVGFANLSTGDEAELHAIYVLPEAWGTGAGRALMAEAVRHLAAAGCREVVLWVLATNERARRFYDKAGWHADGGEAPHEVGGVAHTVVRYRRSLTR